MGTKPRLHIMSMNTAAEEIRVLIIEDEAIWAKSLAADLDSFGYTVAGLADSFESALALLGQQAYDIALLDISIKGRDSGIELGKMLNTVYKKPFIFITASQQSHTLKDAIDAKPSAYLIKPANPSTLLVAIQNALHNFSNSGSQTPISHTEGKAFFFVKQGDKYKKISWEDVVYLRAERNYTYIFNAPDKREYPIRSSLVNTLNYIIPQNLQHKFMQLNRSDVVQLSYSEELAGDELKTAYKTFTITEAFIKEIRRALNILN